MKINLLADWHRLLQEELTEQNVAVRDDLNIAYQYFYYKARQPQMKPRQVLRSAEFRCPPDWEKGLNKIIHKLENGSAIKMHLTLKASPDETPEDFLLADWNIYSLQLKKRVSADREELGPQLFILFKGLAAYLLTTKTQQAWSIKEMLSIIDANWPELLSEMELAGIKGHSAAVERDDYAALRRRNRNVIIALDNGRVFCADQQRYDDDGVRESIKACVQRIEQHLARIEGSIKSEQANVLRRVQKDSGKNVSQLHIMLGRDKEGRAYIGEAGTKLILSRSEGLFDLNC